MFDKKYIYCILIGLCLLVYANSLTGEFVSDDVATIVNNSYLNYPLRQWFDPQGFINSILWRMFKTDVIPYHIASVIVHSAMTLLVFVFLRLFFGIEASFIGAALFAVHPVHAEAVSWVSGRPYALVGLLVLLAFLLYHRAASTIGASRVRPVPLYLLSLGLFSYFAIRGYFYIFFPFMIILFDILYRRWRTAWKLWIPFLAVMVTRFFLARFIIQERITDAAFGPSVSESFRNPIFYAVYSMFYHLRLLVWPVNLTMYHEPVVFNFWPQVAGVIGLCIIVMAMPFLLRAARQVVFGFGVFLIFLALTFSPWPVASVVTERYLYVPSILLSVILAFAYEKTVHRKDGRRRRWVLLIIAFIIAGYGVRTVIRNDDRKDVGRFWRSAAMASPQSSRAHNNLGLTYLQEGNTLRALDEFMTAYRLNPSNYEALINIGALRNDAGQKEDAIPFLQRAIQVNPHRADAYFNLGVVYGDISNFAAAIDAYQKAISSDPSYANAHNNLANIYMKLGMFDKARIHYQKMIELEPDNPDTYYNMGYLFMAMGKDEEAVTFFKKAVETNPTYVAAYSNLGVVYSTLGENNEAITYFLKALEIDPAYVYAYNNLGMIYGKAGDFKEAIKALMKALEIDPSYAAAHFNMANVYYQMGKYDMAIKYCDDARRFGYSVPRDFLEELEPYRTNRP